MRTSSLVVALLLSSIPAWACISLPVPFRLGGSTFESEKLLLGDTDRGIGLTSGEDTFFFDLAKKKWCLRMGPKGEVNCDLNPPLYLTDSKTDSKTLGLIEFANDKREFYIFSVDGKNKKDLSKPYLKFKDSLVKEGDGSFATESLDGEAIIRGRPAGRISRSRIGNFTDDGEFQVIKTRGLTVDSAPSPRSSSSADSVLNMAGNEITSAKCGAPKVSAYDPRSPREGGGNAEK